MSWYSSNLSLICTIRQLVFSPFNVYIPVRSKVNDGPECAPLNFVMAPAVFRLCGHHRGRHIALRINSSMIGTSRADFRSSWGESLSNAYFLESGCVEFFLVRIRQLIIDHTTLVFRSGRYPESLCFAIEHSHSFDCRRVSFCHGVGTPVHDCLCFRIKLGFNRKNCQIIAGGQTKEVLKMQLQTDFPQELRLVSGRDLDAFCVVD